MAHKLTWTDEMDNTLRRMRADGHGFFVISEEIGVGYAQTVLRAEMIGISRSRIAYGRNRGVDVVAAGRGAGR